MMNPPIIIAGMHRSGTSFLSSLFAQIGFNLGKKLFNADFNNQCGYFEDENFLEFNRQIFSAKLIDQQDSYIDWGWSNSQQINDKDLGEYEKEAFKLIENYYSQNDLWAWKDPRNTILLNFWQKIIPEAKFVFIYRFPWEVADSMQRLASPEFLNNPDYAWKIWKFYNQKILDFYKKNESQCLLLSANSLIKNYLNLPQFLNKKFSIRTDRSIASNSFKADLFKTSLDPNIAAQITEIMDPEVLKILKQLEDSADLNSEVVWNQQSVLRFNSRKQDVKMTPKVSILIPCYNQGGFIAEALTSVETYAPDETEIIILNDGSSDQNTNQVLESIANAGYQVLNQENKGLSQARNQMIKYAKADFILPLDADNKICAKFIEEALIILQHQPQTAVVYGHRKEFGMRNRIVHVGKFDIKNMLSLNSIDACAMIRKNAVIEVGGYDSRLKALEDWELWFALATKKWEFANLDFTCFEYRVRPNSMLTQLSSDDFRMECFNYIYQKHASLFTPWLLVKNEELELKLKQELNLYDLKLHQVNELHDRELKQLQEMQKKVADELAVQSSKNEQILIQVQELSIENQNLKNSILDQKEKYLKLQTTMDNILNSKSWVYTEVLRSCASRLRSFIKLQ